MAKDTTKGRPIRLDLELKGTIGSSKGGAEKALTA
jgi:hypothetical protein